MKRNNSLISRRNWLKKTGFAVAALSAPTVLPSHVLGSNAPSGKITSGFIGMGGQGTGRNLGSFLNEKKDTLALAVCDVDLRKAQKAGQIVNKAYGTSDCVVYQDFREVIGRKDIDVIVISTPDHWHVPLSMAALRAGKDVFCEKPSLTIAEGQDLVREVRQRQAVFQWGIEDRSYIKYHYLAGWARSGAIGKLQAIHVTLPQKVPFLKDEVAPVPEELNYNLWLGPAPFSPYTPSRTKPQHWRLMTDYSGGLLTDWGAHLVDTAQVGAKMENSGPIEISGTARELDSEKYQSDVAVEFKLHYRYSNGVDMFVIEDPTADIQFVGTDGWVRCKGWDGVWSASSRDILRIRDFPAGADYWPRPPMEIRDFLNSVKSRKPPAYHVEAGHRLSTTLHLGNIAIRTGKTIKWDPIKETFTGNDAEASDSIIYERPARDWESA